MIIARVRRAWAALFGAETPHDIIPAELWTAPGGEPIDPTEKLNNGRRAHSLLNDPMMLAVINAVADKYRAEWELAPREDFARQQRAHLSLAALRDVCGALRAHLGNATLFEQDLARQRRRNQ